MEGGHDHQILQIIGLENHVAVGLHIQLGAVPITVQLAGLLDEDVVQNVIGGAVHFLHNGAVGQGLVVGDVQILVHKVEAAAHPAAVQTHVIGDLVQVGQDLVMLFVVQVLGGGVGIVKPELHRQTQLADPLQIRNHILCGVVLVQYAVDAHTHQLGNLCQQLVGALLHVLHQMAGYVDAGDLLPVFGHKVQHILRRVLLQHREGGVDVHLVGGGDLIQHHLQRGQVGKGLTAGKDKVAVGGDAIHHADALADLFGAEAVQTAVFFFINAEGAMVAAVIGHEDCDRCAAFSCHIRVVHVVILLERNLYCTTVNLKNQGS